MRRRMGIETGVRPGMAQDTCGQDTYLEIAVASDVIEHISLRPALPSTFRHLIILTFILLFPKEAKIDRTPIHHRSPKSSASRSRSSLGRDRTEAQEGPAVDRTRASAIFERGEKAAPKLRAQIGTTKQSEERAQQSERRSKNGVPRGIRTPVTAVKGQFAADQQTVIAVISL